MFHRSFCLLPLAVAGVAGVACTEAPRVDPPGAPPPSPPLVIVDDGEEGEGEEGEGEEGEGEGEGEANVCRPTTGWTLQDIPAMSTPRAAIARAADDVWAVGGSGQAVHFDGNAWTTTETPSGSQLMSIADGKTPRAVGYGSLLALAGDDTNAEWVDTGVGVDYGNWFDVDADADRGWVAGIDANSQTVVLTFVDDAWSALPTMPANDAPFGVLATSASDVWATGYQRVFRFDGTAWTTFDGFIGTVVDMVAAGPNDIWAGGDGGVFSDDDRLLYHFDGTAWTSEPAPFTAVTRLEVSSSGELWVLDGYRNEVWSRCADGVWTDHSAELPQKSWSGLAVVGDDVWVTGWEPGGFDGVIARRSF